MTPVSRFEADLLRVVHALLGRAPLAGALPLIVGRRERPACLGRGVVALVQDALAKGCVWRLAREGGWRPERHLRGDRVAAGRLWERTPPEELGLSFSRHALAFLIWLTADHPGDQPARWSPDEGELTVGDRVVLFLAYEALRTTQVAPMLRTLPAFSGHGLCRLAFPEDFAGGQAPFEADLTVWIEGPGAAVLEALQPFLAARWVEVERPKGRISDVGRMLDLGREQEATLEFLLRAADGAGRWDLARFLLSAAAALLRDAPGPRAWTGSLELKTLRLSERAEGRRAALVFLRSLDRLRQWERRARAVGYFDEGYAASQLWKADWESHSGDGLCERAAAIARSLDPLGV